MTLHAKMIICNGTAIDLLIWYKLWKILLFFWLEQCLLLWFSDSNSVYFCDFLTRTVFTSVIFSIRRETVNESLDINSEQKTLISNSYSIRQRFQGYRCKSGIVIFTWRLTWNYADSPFKTGMIRGIGWE